MLSAMEEDRLNCGEDARTLRRLELGVSSCSRYPERLLPDEAMLHARCRQWWQIPCQPLRTCAPQWDKGSERGLQVELGIGELLLQRALDGLGGQTSSMSGKWRSRAPLLCCRVESVEVFPPSPCWQRRAIRRSRRIMFAIAECNGIPRHLFGIHALACQRDGDSENLHFFGCKATLKNRAGV